jgi:hypothetical protein
MSLDTQTFLLQHQILDMPNVLVTLSGVDAREIIEDHLNNALVAGNNIYLSYSDIPAPGIVSVATTASLSNINDITASGTVNCNAVVASLVDFGAGTISGTGDIYCNDLHAAASSIYLGDLQLTYNGTHLVVPAEIQADGDMGTDGNLYVDGFVEAIGNLTTSSGSIYIGTAAIEMNDHSIIMGNDAGSSSTGSDVVLIGAEAGEFCGTSQKVVYIGRYAGQYNTGNFNTAIGYRAGYIADSGTNVYMGYYAGAGFTGHSSVFIGGLAGELQSSGNSNTFIGVYAGYGSGSPTSVTNNTLIGYNAGRDLEVGDYNTYLGSNAGYTCASGSYNVFIGYKAGYNETGGNKLYIQNDDSASPLIYGEFDNNLLRFNGNVEFGSYTVSGTGDIYCGNLYTTLEIDSVGDIGTDANLYVDGDINFGGTLLPMVSGTQDLGNDEYPLSEIFLTDQATSQVYNVTIVSGTLTATLV